MMMSLPKRKVEKLDPDIHELQWIDEISECPVFRPSMEEFDDPLLFLQNIAPHASKYGTFIYIYTYSLIQKLAFKYFWFSKYTIYLYYFYNIMQS